MGSFPRRFWTTLGYGIDEQLGTNAFDHALQSAGLCDYNVASLSSVPPNCQIKPIISKGMTYVSYPPIEMMSDPKTMEYFDQFKILRKDIPGEESNSDDLYLKIPTSAIVSMVNITQKGDSFERITAALAIGRYIMHDGTIGVFAFEDHGNKRIVGAVDNGLEGMLRMINMRGRNPVLREGPVPKNIENSEKLAESKYEIDGRELNFYATKGVYYSEKYDFEVYVSTMIVPEGYVGVVLAGAVMDPFTTVHA